MPFEIIARKPVWCIHFWDMKLYHGEILGKDTANSDLCYVRFDGSAINDIEILNLANVFYTEADAEKALFKAKLKGLKRKPNGKTDK